MTLLHPNFERLKSFLRKKNTIFWQHFERLQKMLHMLEQKNSLKCV